MAASWSQRAEQSRGLPNLGFGGTLVTIIITSFFAAKIAGAFCIILSFGARAYFSEGLRVSDWRHAILSNGQGLPWPSNFLLGLGTLLVWAALIGLTELAAGVLTSLLKRFAGWVTDACRGAGGTVLLGFATWFYAPEGILIHPIPMSAFIGGLVLLWKGAGALLSPLTNRFASWATNACRVAGAAVFVAVSLWLWRRWPDLTHPLPLAALIIGGALVCNVTSSVFLDRKQ